MSNIKHDILREHFVSEEARPEDERLWSGLWHATIPQEFIVVASHERFNGSVWAVFSYIVSRMDLATGRSRRLRNAEICEALGISESTLDRAKAKLKEYGFISERQSQGSVYYAPDIERATELARKRKILKVKEARHAEDLAAIAEEEERRGVSMSTRQREAFIQEKFDRKFNPLLV